ncbi:MAG: protoheme IX farnesyltransferase [Cellvibrionales bacterium]|nr:protoheme IX farnesyltransferase [Cellvibrionales bacterium]MCH9797805.1 heme o synthase [Gammaproteobacteria bacterium]MDA7737181.1 heme o synthase [Porticoccus sp.]MCH9842744.1 heme o synthase [Gammaproteobacteria bacterium]MDC0412211.1 heme o synthase [Porticoccus sp.]
MAATDLEKTSFRDYLELTKPKVVALMILTSIIGMFLSVPGMVPIDVLILGNVGIALCAGAAAVINHVVDRKIDLKMSRTLNRPVAKGRVSPYQALLFSTILGLIGMAILLVYINSLTAWLTLASLFGYAVLYTSYLKRATPQNIVIGGLAGAVPPLLGWTAVTGEIHGHALLLVLIIFAWTPPHFWALAVHRKDEYAKAEIPMLPVTHGEKYTKISILLYTVLMILVTLLPFAVGMSGWLYILGALILGAGFLYWAIMMMLDRNPNAGMDTFKYSIVYLMALFIIMLVDHYFI